MSSVLERTLAILELLARSPLGLPLRDIAEQLDIPPSGTHRLLKDLVRTEYVRQDRDHAEYYLTTKLIALGLSYLSENGIVDLAQPVLDRLARESAELVRLGVVSGERLTWVAKAQGARSGLIYDPDMGADAHLASSSSGIAWLMTLSDEKALELVARQGFAQPGQYGPNTPLTALALVERLRVAREAGYALTLETFAAGMNGMAAPIRSPDGHTRGVISIYGPAMRLTHERLVELAPSLLAAAREMSMVSTASPLMRNSGAPAS